MKNFLYHNVNPRLSLSCGCMCVLARSFFDERSKDNQDITKRDVLTLPENLSSFLRRRRMSLVICCRGSDRLDEEQIPTLLPSIGGDGKYATEMFGGCAEGFDEDVCVRD